MKVCIIIVCKNNRHLTKAALSSAQRQTLPATILCIDNGSLDGTTQWLRTKDVSYMCLSWPKPLASCWNTGIAAAWLAGYDSCLVMNNDIVLRPDTVSTLATHTGFITGVSDRDRANIDKWDPSTFYTNQHPDFSCFLIHRSVIDRVGWFDESFDPAYFEDNDYHVRMAHADITAYGSNLPVYHAGSSTLKNSSPAEQEYINRGYEKNKTKFFNKWGFLPGSPEYDDLVGL